MNERIDDSSRASGWVPCPKSDAKTRLCTGMCEIVTPDQEPYVSGEIEETEYSDGIFVEIWVTCHYCPACNDVFSVGIESPTDDAPNDQHDGRHSRTVDGVVGNLEGAE